VAPSFHPVATPYFDLRSRTANSRPLVVGIWERRGCLTRRANYLRLKGQTKASTDASFETPKLDEMVRLVDGDRRAADGGAEFGKSRGDGVRDIVDPRRRT